jgi:hypothetical protein
MGLRTGEGVGEQLQSWMMKREERSLLDSVYWVLLKCAREGRGKDDE